MSSEIVTTRPRKQRRIFMWFFLAIQALFVAGTIALLVADLTQATAAMGLGVGLAIMLWILVDFLLGVGYAVYRLARHP